MTPKSLFLPLLFFLSAPVVDNAAAAVGYYSGTMRILATSGRACGTIAAKSYPVSLVVDRGDDGSLTGYFSGEGITLGKIDGTSAAALTVSYPYHDAERSSGHSMALVEQQGLVQATLHDRHIADDVDECNFDHAVLTVTPQTIEKPESLLDRFAIRYQAQLIRSEAIDLSRRRQLYDAVLRYEKALSLAEQVYPAGSTQRDSFNAALAGSYIKSDMTEEFLRFYDRRFSQLGDDATRAVFNEYKVRILKGAGRKALLKEDFSGALQNFRQAYTLKPQDATLIAGVMAAFLRDGRYDEAISFLEQAENRLENNRDRQEVREATALVMLKQSAILDQKGKTADAEQALKRAALLAPDSARYPVALARLRHKTSGNLAEAEVVLLQAEKKFKDENSRQEIAAGREKIHLVDRVLKKLVGVKR